MNATVKREPGVEHVEDSKDSKAPAQSATMNATMKQEPGVEHTEDRKDSKAPAHSARTCYPPTVPASSSASASQSTSSSSPPACPRVCNDLTLPDPSQTQITNTTTPSQSNYHIHQSTHPLELHLRALLSPPPDPSKTHTLTTGARQCPAHHAIQNHLEDREKRQPHITYYTATPAYDTTFLQTRSTLQPLCGSCVEEETGFDQLLLPPGLDLCRCATILASAE